MGQEPSVIRHEIEETRDRMGETVDAITYRTNVPRRARQRFTGVFGSIRDRVQGSASQLTDATPSGEDFKQGAARTIGIAESNPLGLTIGSMAIGFLAGLAIPSTRPENERLGPVADQVKEKAKETGQEALEHGKQVAQEAADSARSSLEEGVENVKQTVTEQGQQHAQELGETAQQKSQEVRQQI